MEPTKSIGVWIRVSTDFQVKDDSPEHHEKRTACTLNQRGAIKEIYRFEAVSGKSVMGAPYAKRMLRYIRENKITGLIFSKACPPCSYHQRTL